jgi:hypothetical protein
MVDIGGIYFHCISLCVLLSLVYLTGLRLFVYCFICVNLQIVSSLNPFIRADGFWLFADLLGIPNLREQSLGTLERWLYKVLHVRRTPMCRIVQLKPMASTLLMSYTALVILFFVYCSQLVIAQLVTKVLPAYPRACVTLWHSLSGHPFGILHFIDLGIALLWRTIALIGVALFVHRAAIGTYNLCRHIIAAPPYIKTNPSIAGEDSV